MTTVKPKLVVFAGPACSWKTTLAAPLASRLGIPHLQMDETRVRLMPDSPHTRADRAIAYRAMHFAAEVLLGQKVSVILDAPYGHPEDRREIHEIARRTGAYLLLVECRVSPAEAVRRFRNRGPDSMRPDLTEQRVEELARQYAYTGEGLLVDTDAFSPGQCLSLIERYERTTGQGGRHRLRSLFR
jgi:predicted kinase